MSAKIIPWPIVMIKPTPVPSIEEQMDKREEIILQAILKTYADEFAMAVGLACTAASDCLADGGTDEQAFAVAEAAIVEYREKLLRRSAMGMGHE